MLVNIIRECCDNIASHVLTKRGLHRLELSVLALPHNESNNLRMRPGSYESGHQMPKTSLVSSLPPHFFFVKHEWPLDSVADLQTASIICIYVVCSVAKTQFIIDLALVELPKRMKKVIPNLGQAKDINSNSIPC